MADVIFGSGILTSLPILCDSFTILLVSNGSIYIPLKNIFLSIVHGSLVGSGLILYSLGSKKLLSGELTMLSLLEVIDDFALFFKNIKNKKKMNNFENNNCTECYRVIEDLIMLYLQLKIRSTEEVSEQESVSPYFNAFIDH